MANLTLDFLEQLSARADSPAIVASSFGGDRVLTWAEIDEATSRAAVMLREGGIATGDHVWVVQPVSIELYLVLLAIFRIGAVAVFTDPGFSSGQVRSCLEQVCPKAMIANWKVYGAWPRLVRGLGIRERWSVGFFPGKKSWNRWRRFAPASEVASVSDEASALITFTSGSTGLPKGIVRSHGFLRHQLQALRTTLELCPGQRDLSTLPVFVLANLATGVSSILARGNLSRPGFIKARPVLSQIVRWKPDRCTASPAFFMRILDGLERGKCSSSPLSSFGRIYTGGGPVTPSMILRIKRSMPAAQVVAVYGSTEAEPIALLRSHVLLPGLLGGYAAGEVFGEVDLRIVRVPDAVLEGPINAIDVISCPPETVGEIVVSGGHVIPGYLDPAHNAGTKMRIGDRVWHRTGDAGYLDQQGLLWLCGRFKARVTFRGQELFPFQLEGLVEGNPMIRRTALCAIKGKPVLALELKGRMSGISRDLVKQEVECCLQSSGYGDLPIRIVRRIPTDKRHNSKVDYEALLRVLDS